MTDTSKINVDKLVAGEFRKTISTAKGAAFAFRDIAQNLADLLKEPNVVKRFPQHEVGEYNDLDDATLATAPAALGEAKENLRAAIEGLHGSDPTHAAEKLKCAMDYVQDTCWVSDLDYNENVFGNPKWEKHAQVVARERAIAIMNRVTETLMSSSPAFKTAARDIGLSSISLQR